MAERASVPLRDHFKPDCPIVGYWSALAQPTVREVYTTAKEYGGKRVCLEFLEDWAPFHGDDVAIVCGLNGRYLSFHLPVSNSKTSFHRQLYMDYHYGGPLQLPPGFEVDHIVDSATLHQRDNTLGNLQMLSAHEHGLKTARGVIAKKKLAEEAARLSREGGVTTAACQLSMLPNALLSKALCWICWINSLATREQCFAMWLSAAALWRQGGRQATILYHAGCNGFNSFSQSKAASSGVEDS